MFDIQYVVEMVIFNALDQGYSINFIWLSNWTFEGGRGGGGRPDLFLGAYKIGN